MSGPATPSRYQQHLARGLAHYEERTGRRPAAADLDVSIPAVRARYDAFRARPFKFALGATTAEWLQLELGLKSVLRERLNAERLDALRARCAADGWQLHVEPLPPARDDAPLDGADTSPMRDAHAYVGRDLDALREAAALDSKMVPHQSEIVPGLAATAAETRRLGELLGYPPCCTAAFSHWHEHLIDNWQPIAGAAASSVRFAPPLNNLSLSVFHLIAWFPCRYDCPASLDIAQELETQLRRRAPLELDAARAMLALPRVYMDERRQLILDGHPDGHRVRYHAVHTPYALDRSAATAPYEWVFFADVASRVARGDALWLDGDELVIALGTRELERIHAPDAIWLPFAD